MLHQERYFALIQAHPELFANPPDAAITIVLDEAEIGAVEEYMARRLADKGLPPEWAQVGIAYEDQYLMLLRDAVRFPNGMPGTYIRIVAPEGGVPGVVILPVYEGRVLLTRHFRHGTRAWHLEIPRGIGEAGFSSEENARRELAEEIDSQILQLVALGPVRIDDSSAQADEMFYAEVGGYGAPDDVEGIAEILAVPLAAFDSMVADGRIADGYTLAAYARAKARGLL